MPDKKFDHFHFSRLVPDRLNLCGAACRLLGMGTKTSKQTSQAGPKGDGGMKQKFELVCAVADHLAATNPREAIFVLLSVTPIDFSQDLCTVAAIKVHKIRLRALAGEAKFPREAFAAALQDAIARCNQEHLYDQLAAFVLDAIQVLQSRGLRLSGSLLRSYAAPFASTGFDQDALTLTTSTLKSSALSLPCTAQFSWLSARSRPEVDPQAVARLPGAG